MEDTHETVPPAYLHELVTPLRLHDGDLLLVEVAEDWRYDDAQAWAISLCQEVREVHGWTVTAVVLPPGARIEHYRPSHR
jgi:hypothetical protein